MSATNCIDLSSQSQISYHIDLDATPDFERLQQLFYDLYIQRRTDPQYLFVAPRDQIALTRSLCFDCFDESMRRRLFREYGLDSFGGGMVSSVCSSVTGSLVNIVPLPSLESGNVIVGFFH